MKKSTIPDASEAARHIAQAEQLNKQSWEELSQALDAIPQEMSESRAELAAARGAAWVLSVVLGNLAVDFPKPRLPRARKAAGK